MSRVMQVPLRILDRQWRQMVWPLDRPPVKPRQVIVDLTDRCYFRCVTCDKWRLKETPPEMDTEQWRAALAALQQWLGPFHLSISGGEPLLRQDVFDLISQVFGYGGTINLMTNGWQVDETMARKLVRAGLSNLTLSLNGLQAETHDRTRGMPGSHARIMAAVEHFKRARREAQRDPPPTLSLNVILAGYNAGELPDLVRWAEETGIDAVGLQPLADVAAYQPYAALDEDEMLRTVPLPVEHELYQNGGGREVQKTLDELVRLKKQGYPIFNSVRQLQLMRYYFEGDPRLTRKRCTVGLNNFLIDPYGAVRLCYTMQPVGHIRNEPPQEIWHGRRAMEVRRQIRSCEAGCRLLNCNY